MTHSSIEINSPIEVIDMIPVNPLISKCKIKVFYLGANRNGSLITEDVARDIAKSLPGSPVVGAFNEATGDFEEHNRIFEVKGGELTIKDTTRPYGFVDLNAKVWFQDYMDDGEIHKYLCTEAYLWTGQYPEAQRILERGNNHSMELDEGTLQGSWASVNNSEIEFFIINEAIISKLCILGEQFEPCFEGASIGKFSLNLGEDFQNRCLNFIKFMEENCDPKGGKQDMEMIELEKYSALETKFNQLEADYKTLQEQYNELENNFSNKETALDTLQADFNDLNDKFNLKMSEYSELEEKFNELTTANNELVEFKKNKDLEAKQALIDSFYMLSDEEKKDVVENIETYSLDEIESKLAVICVRNKLDMSEKQPEEKKDEPETSFSLQEEENENVPDIVSALRAVKNKE